MQRLSASHRGKQQESGSRSGGRRGGELAQGVAITALSLRVETWLDLPLATPKNIYQIEVGKMLNHTWEAG